jgi:hypothetical protein
MKRAQLRARGDESANGEQRSKIDKGGDPRVLNSCSLLMVLHLGIFQSRRKEEKNKQSKAHESVLLTFLVLADLD